MKKTILYAAALIAAVASCNKPEVDAPVTEEKVWVEFTTGAMTKVTREDVEDDPNIKHKFVWEENDAITVNGETFITSEAGDKVTFGAEVEASFLNETKFDAIYPATAGESFDAITVPSVYDEVPESGFYGIVAVASSENQSFQFKHATSIVRFQVPAAVETVTISADQPLAGTISVEMKETAEVTVNYGVNTVALTGDFEIGKDYYVPVIAGEKSNLTVKFDGNLSKTWTTVTLNQGRVANMGLLPVAKAPRNLAFSAATASATYGEDFTELTLTGVKDDVQYTSSNTAVATVNATTGEVTLKAGGSTTITASAPESDLYLSGSVSYTLTVKENAVIRINNMNGWGDMSITVKVGSTTLVNKKSMTNKGANVFEYTLSPENVGKKVTYYIEHSWYQTSTKEITLTADTQTTPISLNTTYLQTNDWEVDGAVFTVEFKGTGVSTKVVDAVKVKDKFYEIEVPSGNYTKATFRRCNPSDKSVWNKSKEVTLKHMCFCIEGWDENHHGDNRWY